MQKMQKKLKKIWFFLKKALEIILIYQYNRICDYRDILSAV